MRKSQAEIRLSSMLVASAPFPFLCCRTRTGLVQEPCREPERCLCTGALPGRSVGLLGGGQKLGAGVLEVKQLPCCIGKIPAFTLANEAEPSSTGYVNTGFCLRCVRSLMLAQVLWEGEDQL